jgi:hypothetical protein
VILKTDGREKSFLECRCHMRWVSRQPFPITDGGDLRLPSPVPPFCQIPEVYIQILEEILEIFPLSGPDCHP